jgi:hypothetical protein
MKELYDGTFVSDETPTKNIGGLRYLLTQQEIDDKAAEDAANTSASALRQKKKTAMEELDKSDMVAIRCLKAGVPFPQEWKDYVTALRLIVATGEGSLPEQPVYPEGT